MTEAKDRHEKAIAVELKVSMHCKACERLVFNTLCKYKGVETVRTDMNGHKAVVTGRVEPQKLLKKLRKKTGKRAEIVANRDGGGGNADGDGSATVPVSRDCTDYSADHNFFLLGNSEEEGSLVLDFHLFSDENPNACSVM